MVVFMAAVSTAAVFMVEASTVEVSMAVAFIEAGFTAAASTVVSEAVASTPGAFTVAAFTTADIATADSMATITGGISSMARLITTRIITIAGSSGPITARAASVTGTGGITGDTGNHHRYG
jgi:hypothetical protein